MPIRRLLLTALVLLAPMVATAQRGGGMGGRNGGNGGSGRGYNTGPTDAQLGAIDTRDVEKVNPITIMLDRKKDLKLADSAGKAFKSFQSALRDALKPRLRMIDSLDKQLRPRNADQPTGDDTARAENARHQLGAITADIRARYDSVKSLAFAFLDVDQQRKATDFIEKIRADVAESQRQAAGPSRYGARNGNSPGQGTRPGASTLPMPTSQDLVRLNPIATVLERKSELSLADSTVRQLDPLNRTLIASVAPQLKVIDSLTLAVQQHGGAASDDAQPALTQLGILTARIRSQYDVAQSSAFALLSADQRAAAAILIERVRASIQNGRGR